MDGVAASANPLEMGGAASTDNTQRWKSIFDDLCQPAGYISQKYEAEAELAAVMSSGNEVIFRQIAGFINSEFTDIPSFIKRSVRLLCSIGSSSSQISIFLDGLTKSNIDAIKGLCRGLFSISGEIGTVLFVLHNNSDPSTRFKQLVEFMNSVMSLETGTKIALSVGATTHALTGHDSDFANIGGVGNIASLSTVYDLIHQGKQMRPIIDLVKGALNPSGPFVDMEEELKKDITHRLAFLKYMRSLSEKPSASDKLMLVARNKTTKVATEWDDELSAEGMKVVDIGGGKTNKAYDVVKAINEQITSKKGEIGLLTGNIRKEAYENNKGETSFILNRQAERYREQIIDGMSRIEQSLLETFPPGVGPEERTDFEKFAENSRKMNREKGLGGGNRKSKRKRNRKTQRRRRKSNRKKNMR